MNTKQTKLASFIEANANTAAGFLISVLTWKYLVGAIWPEMQPHTGWDKSIYITLLFTAISVARNYFVRRICNKFL